MQKVLTVCDVCAAEQTETPGIEQSVALNGQVRELDLCDDHRKALAEAVEPFMAAGRRPGKSGLANLPMKRPAPPAPDASRATQWYTGDDSDRVTCPHEGCGRTPKNLAAYLQHAITQHGWASAEAKAAIGWTTPMVLCVEPGCSSPGPRPRGQANRHKGMHTRGQTIRQ